MSARLIALCILSALFAACGPKEGDACTNSSMCGTVLICYSCNVPDGGTGVCNHPCNVNADCQGTSSPIGATPICVADTCGHHFCGPQI